jgi:hypothetical protein
MNQEENQSYEGLSDVVARRLIQRVEEIEESAVKQEPDDAPLTKEGSASTDHFLIAETTTTSEPTVEIVDPSVSSVEFTNVEKSLMSIGFFTPSNNRIKNQKVKKITFTKIIDKKRVEATVEFHPSASFGLPITADQDKFLALQDIITDIKRMNGKVSNPIRFTSAELLRRLGKRVRTGKNYKDIGDWLDVMTATMISSKGVVYEHKKGKTATDRFHVFDRAVSIGRELPDGTIADANYVWLSQWQLDNTNLNFILPIDVRGTYSRLKNHITKAFVPFLQIWLYASERAGKFEKRYDELCELLGLQVYRTPSEIIRQLKSSLDELTTHGYLKEWRIEKTSDRTSFKIIFVHGPKFYRDRRKRIEKNEPVEPLIIAHSESAEPELPEPGHINPEPLIPRNKPKAKHSHTLEPAVNANPVYEVEVDENPTPAVPEPQRQSTPVVNPEFLKALTHRETRGWTAITENDARKVLSNIKPEQDVIAQIEYAEYVVARSKGKLTNPTGVAIKYIRENITVPSTFETSQQRKVREEAENQRAQEEADRLQQQENYRAYTKTLIAEYRQENPTEAHRIEAEKAKELRERFKSLTPPLLQSLAKEDADRVIAERVARISFEDFVLAEEAKTSPETMFGSAAVASGMTEVREISELAPSNSDPNPPAPDLAPTQETASDAQQGISPAPIDPTPKLEDSAAGTDGAAETDATTDDQNPL